jgi:hypothetical protein
MLEEKDEEILELMQDYNRIQERSEQKAPPQHLFTITEESSSVYRTEYDEAEEVKSAQKRPDYDVQLDRQSKSHKAEKNELQKIDIEVPSRQLSMQTTEKPTFKVP